MRPPKPTWGWKHQHLTEFKRDRLRRYHRKNLSKPFAWRMYDRAEAKWHRRPWLRRVMRFS
jgi:hypothetical protein